MLKYDPNVLTFDLGDERMSSPKPQVHAARQLEGRTEFRGLNISIENDKGSTRKGVGKDGKAWETTMTYPYGYIRKTEGVDGDHVDCFIGTDENAENVYVIHTKEPSTGESDEDKCFLGFDSGESAKKAFMENYDDERFFGSMDEIPFDDFKDKVLATKEEPQLIKAELDLNSAVDELLSYGTSEGVTKAWDTRGRGKKETFYRGVTTEKLPELVDKGLVPPEKPIDVSTPYGSQFLGAKGYVYVTPDKWAAREYAIFKKKLNDAKPGEEVPVFTFQRIVKPQDSPSTIPNLKPIVVTTQLPKSQVAKMVDDPDSNTGKMYKGTIPKKWITGVEELEADGKWKSIDWKHAVSAEADDGMVTLHFVLDGIDDLDKQDDDLDINAAIAELLAEGLFHGVKITGFTGPEEEYVRATASRVPPELMTNVKEIVCDPSLGAKHGRFVPETKIIYLNPKNVISRLRVGEGQGWIHHGELTTIHEIGHSVYDNFPQEIKDQWMALSGWLKGTNAGQDTPYIEKRAGWEHGISPWTHKKGIKFPRLYSEKSPDEDFADSFAFLLLSKGHQIDRKKKEFLDGLLHQLVKNYPAYSIESPDKPYAEKHVAWALKDLNVKAAVDELMSYGTSEGVTKAWDTRGRGRKEIYHGTSAKFVENIMQDGIHPGSDRKRWGKVFVWATFDKHEAFGYGLSKAAWTSMNMRKKSEGVKENDQVALVVIDPVKTKLKNAYAKDINADTLISYGIPKAAVKRIELYDWNQLERGSTAGKYPKPLKVIKAEGEEGTEMYLLFLPVEDDLQAYGTSEGVTKAWDTRGRGRKEQEWQDLADRLSGVRFHPEVSEQRLKSSPISSESPNDNRGSAASQIISFDDGSKALFKPADGEDTDMRSNITHGFQTQREVGAWEVAKIVGMDDMVAPAVVRKIDGTDGALLEWQDGNVASNEEYDSRFDGEKDSARAAAFDYVIGNEDRHPGNWIVQDDGNLKLIDHGLSFPDSGKFNMTNGYFLSHVSDVYYKPNSDYSPDILAKPYVENEAKIEATLKSLGLPDGSIAGVKTRIMELKNAKKWNELNLWGVK